MWFLPCCQSVLCPLYTTLARTLPCRAPCKIVKFIWHDRSCKILCIDSAHLTWIWNFTSCINISHLLCSKQNIRYNSIIQCIDAVTISKVTRIDHTLFRAWCPIVLVSVSSFSYNLWNADVPSVYHVHIHVLPCFGSRHVWQTMTNVLTKGAVFLNQTKHMHSRN